MPLDAAFTRFPGLTTDRLRLRELRQGDAEALFAILSDEEATAYYGHEPHRSLHDTRALIAEMQARYTQREIIRWAITRRDDDHLIGSCSLHHFDASHHHAETGYELHRACWGQGLMAEALGAILTYGFEELGLQRIEAIIDDANARSKGLLLKLGFSYEGRLRERFYFRGRFEDEYHYGLLRHEWAARALPV